MQYLNDDMDELYRRAAEDYPLNTNSADWNAVLKKIYVDGTGSRGNKKDNKNYKWLLLLLLLPAAWIGKEYFYSSNTQSGNNSLTQNVSKNTPTFVSFSRPKSKLRLSAATMIISRFRATIWT